jgi:hypothetical protein
LAARQPTAFINNCHPSSRWSYKLKIAFLLAQRQGLRQHGQDDGHQPENHGRLRGIALKDNRRNGAGDDEDLPRMKRST